jgi:hypothetical protein
MLKVIPFFLLLLLSTFSALANEIKLDTIYIIGKPDAILASANINYKKKIVQLYDSSGKKMGETDFIQILQIRCSNGNSYTRRDSQGKSLMLMRLIIGKYSLLHDKGTGTYFVDISDTLKILSKDHFKRALPLIFTNTLLETFHRDSNLRPDYSSKYFRRLVHFANKSANVLDVNYSENISDLRIKFFIGPYVGYSKGKTYFRYVAKNWKTNSYDRTKPYSNFAIPFGFRTKAELTKRLDFEVASYLNIATITDFSNDNSGFFNMFSIGGIKVPKQFKYPVGLESYTFTTLNFDMSVNYFFRFKNLSRFQPNIFLGPSLVIMMDRKVKVSTQLITNNEIDGYYDFHISRKNQRDLMAGIHGGLGLDYKFTERFLINVSTRIQAGVFTKIKPRPEEDVVAAANGQTPFGSPRGSQFDQPLQQIQFAGSALFRLW